jgi:DNA-binding NtrC family response regulator
MTTIQLAKEPTLLQVLTSQIIAGRIPAHEARAIVIRHRKALLEKQLRQAINVEVSELRTLEEITFAAIRNAMEETGHDVAETAKRLRISRTTLYRKLKKVAA